MKSPEGVQKLYLAVEVFLERTEKKRVWQKILLGLYLLSLANCFTMRSSAPEYLAKLNQFTARAQALKNEENALITTSKKVDDCTQSIRFMSDTFAELTQRESKGEIVKTEDALKGFAALLVARTKTAETKGMLRGSNFENTGASSIFKQYEGIFATAETIIEESSAYYAAYFKAQSQDERSRAFRGHATMQFVEKAAELRAEIDTLNRKLPTIEEDWNNEVEQNIHEVSAIAITIVFALLSLLYLVGMSAVIFIQIRHCWPEAMQRWQDSHAQVKLQPALERTGLPPAPVSPEITPKDQE
jgi:hypothetical protein